MEHRVRFYDLGEGPAVVLLHGFTSSFDGTWARRGWVDELAGVGHRVVGLDFPGHGGSDPAPDCGPERLVDDVLGVLDELGLGAPDLMGFSMGGGVALRLAGEHPQRVSRLVVGGVGDPGINGRHDREGLKRGWSRMRTAAVERGLDPSALEPYFTGRGWPAGLDEPLPPIAAPTLLFLAEADQYMRPTERTEAWLAHAEIFRSRGRDHYQVLDDPALHLAVPAFLR
jgi:pimeloyl-ACP methyl ester carboxylesterase